MCFPSSLPSDPLHCPETLVSISCKDPPLTPPSDRRLSVVSEESGGGLPVGAPDKSSLLSGLTLTCSEDRVELGLEEESGVGCKKVLEEDDLESYVDGKKVQRQVGGSGGRGKKVLEEDCEASSSCSLDRDRNVWNQCGRNSRHGVSSSGFASDFNESSFRTSTFDSDRDGTETETRLHMLAPSLRRPSPPSPPPVGAGLANLGNTCFLNAVMQCFTHTVLLVLGLHLLCDGGVPSHHNDEEFCVLSAVCDHIFRALATSGRVIFPNNLVNNLSYISSLFQRYQQEDAHEFLQCLLDKIDTCWSKCKVDNKGMSSKGSSLVKQVFGGRLVSQLHCCKCGHRSDTYEPLFDLSLEIEDADDLSGALESFTKMEKIEDEEVKFTCENCKEQVPVKKQLMLEQAPSVAALHLKRFKSNGYFVEKIDKTLDYPLELDLKPYTVDAQNENVELKYELYAIIVHLGFSSTSGHYFCYIRSSPDKWFQIDDSKVTEVPEGVALSQQGYILFYARKGTPWPCTLVKSSCDYDVWNTSPKSVLDSVEHIRSSDPRRVSLYNEKVVESKGVNGEINAQLRCEQLFDEVCCIAQSTDANEGAASEPSVGPRHDVGNEELVNVNSSSLSGNLKYNQVESITNEDPQGFMPINDSGWEQTHELLCNEEFVDEYSTHHYTGSVDNDVEIRTDMDAQGFMTGKDSICGGSSTSRHAVCDKDLLDGDVNNLSIGPEGEGNIKHEIKGFISNVNMCQSSRSRSRSPDIYESEEHPDVAHPRCLKKSKAENRATLTRTNRTMDRKKKEAMRSLCKIPAAGRRHMLKAALIGSRNEGLINKNRRRSKF